MCDCMKQINDELAQYNTRLDPVMALRDGTLHMAGVRIETVKIDSKKRGRPKRLVASYCPFCGKKYDVERPAP